MRFTVHGRARRKASNKRPIIRNPTRMPVSGAAIIGMITLGHNPVHSCLAGSNTFQWIADHLPPAEANAAPHKPPMSAWLELDGRPIHQVRRFQAIPPIRAHIMVLSVMRFLSTSPVPIVLATAVPANAPMRLNTVDNKMACRGVNTRVDMDVAMPLAESWNPLIYSKINAIRITVTISTIVPPRL